MNAPNKIYLTPLLIEGCSKNLSKRVTENDVEYIRKDSLIEWLRQRLSLAGVLKSEAYRSVIDKLNSL